MRGDGLEKYLMMGMGAGSGNPKRRWTDEVREMTRLSLYTN